MGYSPNKTVFSPPSPLWCAIIKLSAHLTSSEYSWEAPFCNRQWWLFTFNFRLHFLLTVNRPFLNWITRPWLIGRKTSIHIFPRSRIHSPFHPRELYQGLALSDKTEFSSLHFQSPNIFNHKLGTFLKIT